MSDQRWRQEVSDVLEAIAHNVDRAIGELAEEVKALRATIRGTEAGVHGSHFKHSYTRRRIVQIMPAPPNTYALFKSEDGKVYQRHMVPAWGLWDEWEVEVDERRRETGRVSAVERSAGPLITEFGHLEPAAASGDYHGIRCGGWVESAGGGGWFDSGEPNEEIVPDDERKLVLGWAPTPKPTSGG
jgi:hypothetical protein